ncbi:hypothetical protein TNIN_75371 [Trichonephila inaurata madagascariensis]|uniref:Uncharacterized protein n=1 Tax=Trichonephila inaurata madagascariensis TaxID=2747483 RepID=A0A8X6WZU9_9ARAC|nr:hypothetical protein TNIN_75371 [Trichonephila inaurata madagascariensis]
MKTAQLQFFHPFFDPSTSQHIPLEIFCLIIGPCDVFKIMHIEHSRFGVIKLWLAKRRFASKMNSFGRILWRMLLISGMEIEGEEEEYFTICFLIEYWGKGVSGVCEWIAVNEPQKLPLVRGLD